MSINKVFYLECSSPLSDNFFGLQDLVEYLNKHMKVNELRNNLTSKISIEAEPKEKRITISSNVKYSKRACRYYARKFLKKQDLRDRFRLISSKKDTYEMRPYRISTNE